MPADKPLISNGNSLDQLLTTPDWIGISGCRLQQSPLGSEGRPHFPGGIPIDGRSLEEHRRMRSRGYLASLVSGVVMRASVFKASALLGSCIGSALCTAAPAIADVSTNVMFIFDASGSMKRAAGDETRLAAAKRGLSEALQAMPDDAQIGLIAFGHRRAKDCTDIEIVSPIGADKPADLAHMVESFQALGETPIASAIDRAGRSLKAFKGQPNSIVLVTDGVEECGGDPCAATARLIDAGIDVKIHVVGFSLAAGQDDKLRCIVDQTGGTYFGAQDVAELNHTLSEVRTLVAETATVQPAAAVSTISPKTASKDLNAPTSIERGQIVKARIGASGDTGVYHYWKVSAPPGKYLIVQDQERADDQHSNIRGSINALRSNGENLGEVAKTNAIEYRVRTVGAIEIDAQSDLVLRIDNEYSIIDYWLGLFPVDAEITSPYFVRTPQVKPLEIGVPISTVLDPKGDAPPEAWYSTNLQGSDYRISLELRRTKGNKSNVRGLVEAFGPLGDSGTKMSICEINEIDVAAKCTAKLSLVDDSKVLFRLSPMHDDAYKATLLIEPLSNE